MRIVALALSASLLSGCSLQEYASDETNDIIDIFVNSITSGDLSEELANGALLYDSIDIHSNVVDPSLFSLDIKSVENAPAKVPLPLSLEGPVNGGISSNTGNDVLEITDASQDDDFYTREKFTQNVIIYVGYVGYSDEEGTGNHKRAYVPTTARTNFCSNHTALGVKEVQAHFDALVDRWLFDPVAIKDECGCNKVHGADVSIKFTSKESLPDYSKDVHKFAEDVMNELNDSERKFNNFSNHVEGYTEGDVTDCALAFRASGTYKLCILIQYDDYSTRDEKFVAEWYGDNSIANKLADKLKSSTGIGQVEISVNEGKVQYLADYATENSNSSMYNNTSILVLKLRDTNVNSIDVKKFADEIVKAVNGE